MNIFVPILIRMSRIKKAMKKISVWFFRHVEPFDRECQIYVTRIEPGVRRVLFLCIIIFIINRNIIGTAKLRLRYSYSYDFLLSDILSYILKTHLTLNVLFFLVFSHLFHCHYFHLLSFLCVMLLISSFKKT